MPIMKKAVSDKDFTIIPNAILWNENLSLSAKGMLCYMLSCRDDWKFTIKGLCSFLHITDHMCVKTLKELADAGYHKKEALREGGKIVEWKYYVADTPMFLGEVSEPEPEKPKKKSLYDQCCEIIEEEFRDETIRLALKDYLSQRINCKGLCAKGWRTTILQLNKCPNKQNVLDTIAEAKNRGWLSFYPKNYRKNQFVDDLQPNNEPKDAETLLKEKYMQEFESVPKWDRPSFEEWRKSA